MTNREALANIYLEIFGLDVADTREDQRRIAGEVAGRLAARGVLAVDSLTDEQLLGVPSVRNWSTPDAARAALRRCATGSPPEGRRDG